MNSVQCSTALQLYCSTALLASCSFDHYLRCFCFSLVLVGLAFANFPAAGLMVKRHSHSALAASKVSDCRHRVFSGGLLDHHVLRAWSGSSLSNHLPGLHKCIYHIISCLVLLTNHSTKYIHTSIHSINRKRLADLFFELPRKQVNNT